MEENTAPEPQEDLPPENGDKTVTELPADKKTEKKLHAKKTAVQYAVMNVGALMMAVSVYFFQAPNNLTLGGVGGLSIMLSEQITPHVEWLTQPLIMGIINALLLILGFIMLGRKSMFRTIICTIAYTAEMLLFDYLNLISLINGGQSATLTNQPFLELCYAILLYGVGGALIFNSGSTSGGTDIVALILKKFTSLNVGICLLIVDMIVLVSSFFVFQDTTTALFSCIGLFAKSFLLDGVIESMGKTKFITIITKDHEKIAEYILNVVKHGYTMYDAEGGYTGERKKVMVTVCKRTEALKLKLKVKSLDPQAFVIITDANEILGKGFGETD